MNDDEKIYEVRAEDGTIGVMSPKRRVFKASSDADAEKLAKEFLIDVSVDSGILYLNQPDDEGNPQTKIGRVEID